MSNDLAYYLKRLRLSHITQHLPPLLERAVAEEWSYQEFLTSLLEAEVFSREQQAIEQRMRTAHLPVRKTLEQFDFSFQTSVKRQVMLHLANLDFIQTRTNVLFVGGRPAQARCIWRSPSRSRHARRAARCSS